MIRSALRVALTTAPLALLASPAVAQFNDLATPESPHSVVESEDGTIVASDETGTYLYPGWDEYLTSGFFLRHGKRCGSDALHLPPTVAYLGSQNDCTNSRTVPSSEYDPSGGTATVYDIPVVFHVLYANNGTGNIPDARINEQIAILNADFASLTDSKIQFHLATEDPSGGATNGITRHKSNRWYNDGGNYANSIGWDTNRYLNIYTNTAGGNLGYAYVPNGGGVVGANFDGVRLLWRAVGNTTYAPYDMGRTGTHEVGHYLGLFHTFDGGCDSGGCNTSGDLICDTNPEASPNYNACFPSQRTTCTGQDPVRNYMDYSEDACMDNFTFEQSLRMRCTLDNWRVDLANWDGGGTGGTAPDQTSGPTPGNGATGVATSADLSWAAANGATQYDVYFGTSSNPPLVSSNQSGTSFGLGTLAQSTTYYWRVDSENGDGTTTGNVWSFETTGGGTGGPIFSDGFESGSLSGWSTSNNDARVGTNSNTGTYAAECRRSSSITRTINTGSATSVNVSWAWRTSGYDSGERARVTITGGSSPITLETTATSYTAGSTTVNGVSGSITIRFEGIANRKNERAYIDDIVVQ